MKDIEKQHMMELLFRHIDEWLRVDVVGPQDLLRFRVVWEGPRDWNFTVPYLRAQNVGRIRQVQPTTVSLSDFIKDTLPGMWGYLPEHERDAEICLKCGKTFTETVPAQMLPPSPTHQTGDA